MKTLSTTEARQNLGSWLARALKGEDIGIVCGGRIVALRPVEVYSEDYAMIEYGLTKKAVESAYEKISKEVAAERRTGGLKKFV
jgi:antitoxin (DNA-binding transcriptional repressor) of toxin-antitoxin stability system